MSKEAEKKMREVYLAERLSVAEKLARYNMDIKTLERTDAKIVVATRILRKDKNGQPESTEEITAGEHIKSLMSSREGLILRMQAIGILLNE